MFGLSRLERNSKHFQCTVYWINGIAYEWSGWFGSQLESHEWRRVPAGTTRTLSVGYDKKPITVTVFSTVREGLKYRTTWAVSKNGTHAEHDSRIRELLAALKT